MLKFTYVLRSIYYKCTIQTKLHDMRSSTLYGIYMYVYIYLFSFVRKSGLNDQHELRPLFKGRNVRCRNIFQSVFLNFRLSTRAAVLPNNGSKNNNRCTKITCTVKTR